MQFMHLVGVDEAGRGPLAGPVAVGIAVVPYDFDLLSLPGVADSKQLSEQKREEVFMKANELERRGILSYVVTLVSAKTIDQIGISASVKQGIERGFKKIQLDPLSVKVKLDGLLYAPTEFTFQETIIKGDQKEKVIGLASILAKVTRDRYMVNLASKYPEYDFGVHKGYGTKRHRAQIATFGLSPVHRTSFCRNIKIVV